MITDRTKAVTDHCTTLEQDALVEIKNACKINDGPWKHFIELVSSIKRYNREKLLKTPRKTYEHSRQIPTDILRIINNLLSTQGIQPTALDIKILDNKKSHSHADFVTLASIVQGMRWNPKLITKESIHLKTPTLYINPELFNKSKADIEFTILHEMGHLLEAHPVVEVLINALFSKYFTSDTAKAARDNLDIIHEYIADQYVAVQSKELRQKGLTRLKAKANIPGSHRRPSSAYPSPYERYISYKEMCELYDQNQKRL